MKTWEKFILPVLALVIGVAVFNEARQSVACTKAGGDRVLNGICYKLTLVPIEVKK